MTDKPTPTDAELNTILCAHWPAFAAQSTLVKIWVRDAVQDAIDKWGQPAQAAESRTIPDREIPGIVERALQELEGLVKYATSTYGHWDMRRAKGALSDLEWWARRKLAAHAQAAEPVAPDFFTVCAWHEGGGEAGWIPLPGYSNETEHGVRHLVLEAARKEGYKGTAAGRLLELGWEIRPVHLTPQPAQTQAGAGARSCGCEASPGPCLLQHQGVTGVGISFDCQVCKSARTVSE